MIVVNAERVIFFACTFSLVVSVAEKNNSSCPIKGKQLSAAVRTKNSCNTSPKALWIQFPFQQQVFINKTMVQITFVWPYHQAPTAKALRVSQKYPDACVFLSIPPPGAQPFSCVIVEVFAETGSPLNVQLYNGSGQTIDQIWLFTSKNSRVHNPLIWLKPLPENCSEIMLAVEKSKESQIDLLTNGSVKCEHIIYPLRRMSDLFMEEFQSAVFSMPHRMTDVRISIENHHIKRGFNINLTPCALNSSHIAYHYVGRQSRSHNNFTYYVTLVMLAIVSMLLVIFSTIWCLKRNYYHLKFVDFTINSPQMYLDACHEMSNAELINYLQRYMFLR